jgi:hypothetical protein
MISEGRIQLKSRHENNPTIDKSAEDAVHPGLSPFGSRKPDAEKRTSVMKKSF